jgi:hypothetical protein
LSRYRLVIGADLSKDRPEICYYDKTTKQSAAMPMKIGNIPVTFEGLVDGDGGNEDSVKMVTNLFREVFLTIGAEDIPRDVACIMVTFPETSQSLLSLIRQVFQNLEIPRSRAYVQDYKESFFYYMTYQRTELWTRNAGLFSFRPDSVRFFRMSRGSVKNPRVIRTTETAPVPLDSDGFERDREFADYARKCMGNEIFSSIFITGDGFDETWADESKSFLCAKRRKVFTEDSVFARGACNAAREKSGVQRLSGLTYVSDSLVPFNIGMNMESGGKVSVYPLITGGAHWYNTVCDCEFLLGSEKKLTFQISGVETGGKFLKTMELSGLPDRPPRTTRLHLHIEFTGKNCCEATVTDLGFGEIFPSSGKVWTEVLGDFE